MDSESRERCREYVAARYPRLLRTAYLLTGSHADAEDLLQTVLAKVYLKWDRVEQVAVDAYVQRAMVNARTSLWRRHRGREIAVDAAPERTGRDAMADSDLHDALWAALATLPRRQRAAVVLRYYEDLPEREVAEILGISIGAVKSAVSRALAKLRDNAGLRDNPDAELPTTWELGVN